jgi:outer membrane protein TolC
MKNLLGFLMFFLLLLQQPCGVFAGEALELVLSQAVSIALKENLSLKSEGLNIPFAQAEVLVREGEFDPSFNLGLSQDYAKIDSVSSLIPSERRQTDGFASFAGKLKTGTQYELRWDNARVKSNLGFLTVNPYYSSETALRLSQPLLKGWGMSVQTANIDVARKNIDISSYRERKKAEDIILQTARAYWDLYFRKKDVEVSHLSLRLSEAVSKEVSEKIDVGVLAPIEASEAEANVYARKQELILAEKAMRDAEDTLKKILNFHDWSKAIVPVEEPRVEAVADIEEPYQDILNRRWEYKSSLTELRNRETIRNFYKNQVLPDLSVFGSAGLDGVNDGYSNAVSDMGSTDFYSWELGVNLTVPIGNNAARGNYRKALYEEEKAKLAVSETEQSVIYEVREARRASRVAFDTWEAAVKKREATQKRYEAERERFAVGLAVLNDVLRLEVDYSRSLSQEYFAITAYVFSLVKLDQATGRVLERFAQGQ